MVYALGMTKLSLIQSWHEKAAGRKLVLHIGCGASGAEKLYPRYQTPEWCEIRIDMDKAAKPDLLADIRDMNAIAHDSVDAIWTSHTIEHLEAHDVPKALAECYRVLKPEGEMGVATPDLQSIALHVAHGRLETPLYTAPSGSPIRALDVLYGLESDIARGHPFMAHRTGFTSETLGKKLTHAGFTNITILRKELNLWAGAFKYPSGHPKRAEKTKLLTEKAETPPPAPPLQQQPHPGLMHKGKLPDELDVPPKQWLN